MRVIRAVPSLDRLSWLRCHPGNSPGTKAVTMPCISFHTPVGDFTLSEEGNAIVAADWGWASIQRETPLLREAINRLERYFDGELVTFVDLPLAPVGGTPYRRRVWAGLQAIPAGETRTYADLARSVGGSPRAVGMANAANPIPILIPCHRVVAQNGLGGYSGGDGVSTKRFLLTLEARNARGTQSLLDAIGG